MPDIIEEVIEHIRLIITAGVLIFVLAVLGSAFAKLPGGALSSQTANLGIVAIGLIVTGAGIAGVIAFIKWLQNNYSF